MLTSESRRLERADQLKAPRPASAGLGYRDGDVVAGVGGVRGELRVQDLRRVGHEAQFGLTGRHVVVDPRFAVAAHQGDTDTDVRVGFRSYLYNVRVLDHRIGTDRGDRACHGGVDGGTRRCADVDGTGLGSIPSCRVHNVVVDPLGRLSPGEEADERVGREVLAPRFHRGEALALGMVAEPGEARGTDRGGDIDPGGPASTVSGPALFGSIGTARSAVSAALVCTNTATTSATAPSTSREMAIKRRLL